MPTYKATAQVVINEPLHLSKTPTNKAGDIIAIHDFINEAPNPNGRLGFVHVTNIPETVLLKNLGDELSRAVSSNAEVEKRTIEKRAWKVDLNQITVIGNQATITWEQARSLFIRKYDGLTGGEFYDGLGA